jgi:transcriptional regulator with XRE-family HTH domain
LPRIEGFDTNAYKLRLRLLREIVSGENQADFAQRLGIPFKRWNNYERGYPVPRETAFLLMKRFPGLSVEWLWFGMTGNLSNFYQEKIKVAEGFEKERVAAERAASKAAAKLKEVTGKRKKAIYPAASARSR